MCCIIADYLRGPWSIALSDNSTENCFTLALLKCRQVNRFHTRFNTKTLHVSQAINRWPACFSDLSFADSMEDQKPNPNPY